MKKSIFIFGAIIVAAILFYPQATIGKLTGSPLVSNLGDYLTLSTLSASEFSPTNITETSNFHIKEILKITDILGRETKDIKNKPLFYIYNDGAVEKKIIIE